MMSSIFGEESVQTEVKATEFKPPKCITFLEKWRFCRSAKNQFHRYYIYGEMQDCSVYWKAFSSCATYTYNKSSESKLNSDMEGLITNNYNYNKQRQLSLCWKS